MIACHRLGAAVPALPHNCWKYDSHLVIERGLWDYSTALVQRTETRRESRARLLESNWGQVERFNKGPPGSHPAPNSAAPPSPSASFQSEMNADSHLNHTGISLTYIAIRTISIALKYQFESHFDPPVLGW